MVIMKGRNAIFKLCCCLVALLLVISITSGLNLNPSVFAARVSIAISTDNAEKSVRQQVALRGNVNESGLPVANVLVAVEVLDSRNDPNNPLVYRTITIGNPTEAWALEIVAVSVADSDLNSINTVKIGNPVFVQATVRNNQAVDRNAWVTISILDSSMTPIATMNSLLTVSSQSSSACVQSFIVPGWAASGVASAICDIYNADPRSGGRPFAPENIGHFLISRYEQGTCQFQVATPPTPPLGPGEFLMSFHLPPDSRPGSYYVYAIARVSVVEFSPVQTTTFSVSSTQYPPEASFTYFPAYPYKNMTVQFDASFSSAEGADNAIVSYAWNFGDGTQSMTTSPIVSNKRFVASASRFLVTLNVTDKNGLSATESKYVYIKSPSLTASFTCPSVAFGNRTVTFNASSCNPGWDVSKGAYGTIVQYKWNFGDGTGNFATANPAIDHVFTHIGNYTVTLMATSSGGLSNSTSNTVRIIAGTGLIGDITGPNGVPDGIVDITDLALVVHCYGSMPGMPNWDPRADITGSTYLVPDGLVDVSDVSLLVRHYGDHL